MIEQGDVLKLVIMGILFVLMGILISSIGKGKGAVKETQPSASGQVSVKAGNMPAVTAAITAAVNEYRKTNKS